MNGEFGRFVKEKRTSLGMTLRGLALALDIAPAFMSDIEKGHRYPPKKQTLDKLAVALHLTESETNRMFDLAAEEKENAVSPDLPEYIMGNEQVRIALRMARDSENSDKVWQKVIEMLETEAKENDRS